MCPTDPRIINTFGIVLSIVGSGLWFFFGWPQPTHQPPTGSLLLLDVPPEEEAETARQAEEVAKTQKRYVRICRVSLLLLALGFAFQLWATWAPPVSAPQSAPAKAPAASAAQRSAP